MNLKGGAYYTRLYVQVYKQILINLTIFYHQRTLHESMVKVKNSEIFSMFLKNGVNSKVVERLFKENRGKLNIINSLYLSCKGL